MKNKKLWIIAGIVAVAAIAFGYVMYKGRPVQTGEKPTIRIAQMLPLTGDKAVFGTTSAAVAEMFIAEWREKNPNAKYNYEIVYENVQTPAEATTGLNRLASLKEVDATYTFITGLSLALSPVTEKNKIVHLSYSLDDHAAIGEYNYILKPDVGAAMEKLLEHLYDIGKRKIALIVASDGGPAANGKEFMNVFSKQNKIAMVGEPHYINTGEKDFRILLQKIKNSGADAIVYMAVPPEADILIFQARQMNLGIDITGYHTINMVKDKKTVEGMWNIDEPLINPDFAKRIMSAAKTETTYYSEHTWTILSVLFAAFESAPAKPGFKPAAIDVAKQIPIVARGMQNPMGTLGVDADGNVVLPAPTVQKIVNGKIMTMVK